jgi:hypothetical protein
LLLAPTGGSRQCVKVPAMKAKRTVIDRSATPLPGPSRRSTALDVAQAPQRGAQLLAKAVLVRVKARVLILPSSIVSSMLIAC